MFLACLWPLHYCRPMSVQKALIRVVVMQFPTTLSPSSPFHVSWSVRPKVAKVNIETVGNWCKGNTFKEDHAHGVRNLVTNHDLLSEITK